ncbi:MAG: hypothetical protein GQ570_04850 [Helicobacteraceae bacterium]|nr:hypothetical protein [Helicobacteraceae bacterium]
MDKLNPGIIILIMGVVVVFITIIIFIFTVYRNVQHRQTKKDQVLGSSAKAIKLVELLATVQKEGTTKEELDDVIDNIMRFHAYLPEKKDGKADPIFKTYHSIVISLRSYSHNVELIKSLEELLIKDNPSYEKDFTDIFEGN